MTEPVEQVRLEEQRRIVRRAKAEGRRWFLRGALMLAVAFWCFRLGGSLYITVGAAMTLLGVLSFQMGRSLRRSAAEAAQKLALMEPQR